MSRRMVLFGIFAVFLWFSPGFAEPVTVATIETIDGPDTVYVGEPPPAPRVETKPPAPGPKAVWIGGFWQWRANKYVWMPGHWEKAPKGQWVPGHWQKHRRGYVWTAGQWTKKAPEPRKRWVKGHWRKHKGTRIWVAGHWEL